MTCLIFNAPCWASYGQEYDEWLEKNNLPKHIDFEVPPDPVFIRTVTREDNGYNYSTTIIYPKESNDYNCAETYEGQVCY